MVRVHLHSWVHLTIQVDFFKQLVLFQCWKYAAGATFAYLTMIHAIPPMVFDNF